MLTILPLFLGKLGATEVILIVVLFIILFGGKKIPELMKGMGRGVKEFKDAVNKDYTQPDNTPDKSGEAEKSETDKSAEKIDKADKI